MDIVVISATTEEVYNFEKFFNNRDWRQSPKDFFFKDPLKDGSNNIHPIISGVGKLNAAKAISSYKQLLDANSGGNWNDFLINIGTVCSPVLPIGTILLATDFHEGDAFSSDGFNSFAFKTNQTGFENTITTGDVFVHDASTIKTDMYDMESYALASFCYYNGIPFYSIKVVSDNGNMTSEEWAESARLLSSKLEHELIDVLNHLDSASAESLRKSFTLSKYNSKTY